MLLLLLLLKIYKELYTYFSGSDGPPYRMASQIIEENKEEYDWVSLLLGMGHLHMNQMKCLFKILNKIFLEVLGKEVLNFKSSKAYSFFVSTSDTHKSELKAKHQDGDFHLEGKIESHKMFAPKGHITNELWRRLS